MHFPVTFRLLSFDLPAHLLFDLVAYTGGTRLYFALRKRIPHPQLDAYTNLWLLAALLLGAVSGAKLLAWVEDLEGFRIALQNRQLLQSGKTIVGGILGGWAGIEVAKKCFRIQQSTGDAFAIPLLFGIGIGRIGCFLSGLADQTHGLPASVPWAVDLGDGIPRHPVQLYEALFAVTVGCLLLTHRLRRFPAGTRFRIGVGSYLALRVLIDFIKPRPHLYWGLSAIQWAAIAGLFICVHWLIRSRPHHG